MPLDNIFASSQQSLFDDPLNEYHLKVIRGIMEQREEILRAFVAKYGFEPDQAMQVIEQTLSGFRWYVVRR